MTKPVKWSWVLLLTTSTTLVCCAIPAILVTLGFGAVVAAMVSAAPWLVTLSQYKVALFAGSGLLIVLAAWVVYRPGRSCPVEPELAAACAQADRWNRLFIHIAAMLWVIGFLAAYVLPRLQQ